jgi:ribosomal RNA-processing protein 17
MREERAADFERALEEHKKQLKKLNEENESGDDAENSSSDAEEDEWDGIEEPPAVDYEAEYIDEDKYTTVTVEEMDPSNQSNLRTNGDSSDERPTERPEPSGEDVKSKEQPKKKKQADDKLKKKKKKFRYETKEERKVTRMKQRMSNHRKAQARREK